MLREPGIGGQSRQLTRMHVLLTIPGGKWQECNSVNQKASKNIGCSYDESYKSNRELQLCVQNALELSDSLLPLVMQVRGQWRG